MKKKTTISFILAVIFVFFHSGSIFAAGGTPYLKSSKVEVINDGEMNNQIVQEITIGNIDSAVSKTIEHTLSFINQVQPENVSFTANGEELTFSMEETRTLARYALEIPDGVIGDFSYQITYSTKFNQGDFNIPIFVPQYPALGSDNVVTIHFQTAEDKVIQGNSFPILKKNGGNEVTSYLMNLSSHVKFVVGDKKNPFHSFTYYSWGSLIVLFLIIFIWIRSELKTAKKGVVQ